MKPLLLVLTTTAFLLLGLVTLGQAQEAESAQTTQAAPTLQGRWTLSGSLRSVEARRDAAIERVTDEMSIFARGIAGRRLRAGMPVPRELVIEGDGTNFRAKVGDYDLNFAADGSRHAMTDPFGEDISASQRFANGRLRQTMRADGGTLTHVVQLNQDGQTLTLTVRVASSRLPADIVYRIRFRRR